MEPGLGPAAAGYARWSSSLPVDYKRAAAEIYRNLRQQGSSSTREWLVQNHTGYKGGSEWQSLWTMACQVDFELGGVTNDAELQQKLGTSDSLEMNLRHLAAFVYEKRTGDKSGAAEIRAVVAPGSNADIAPGWLVTDATVHSKAEFQRSERVQTEARRRPTAAARGGAALHGKGRGKGKGKDKDKPPG